MKFCTQCGAQLREGVKFCTQCGHPVTQNVTFTQNGSRKPANKKIAIVILCIVLAVAIVAGLLLFLFNYIKNLHADILGRYNSISYSYSGQETDVDDEWIELKSFGIAKLMLLDKEYFALWKLDDTDFTLMQGGLTYEGTLEDGVLILDLDGVVYTYASEDADLPSDDDKPSSSHRPEDNDQPADDSVEVPTEAVSSALGFWTLKYTEGVGDMTKSEEEIIAMREDMGIEIYVQLNEDGTGLFNWAELSEITWDAESLIGPDGSPAPYTLENGELVVNIEGTYFYFVPADGPSVIPGTAAGYPTDQEDPSAFSGDYYGWWYYADVLTGDVEMQGYWWDCCMTLDIASNGTGTMTIWDEDYDRDTPMAEVEISVTVTDGVAEFVSESGYFLGCDVGYADWVFYSDDADYDNALGFYTMYTTSEFEIECYFLLRPWGALWDDVPDYDQPYYYTDWYLPLIEEGVTEAPNTIG